VRPVLDHAEAACRPVPSTRSPGGYYRPRHRPSIPSPPKTRQLIRDAKDTLGADGVGTEASPSAAVPLFRIRSLDAVARRARGGSSRGTPETLTSSQEKHLAWRILWRARTSDRHHHAPALTDKGAFDAHRRAARLWRGEDCGRVQELQRCESAPELGAVALGGRQADGRTGGRRGRRGAGTRRQGLARSLAVDCPQAMWLRRRRPSSNRQEVRGGGHRAGGARHGQVTAWRRYESAARVALALRDAAAATTHATVSAEVESGQRLPRFVRGRLLFDQASSRRRCGVLRRRRTGADDAPAPTPVAELELYRGESLVHLDRAEDAEAAFPQRDSRVPRDPRAYLSLATLYTSTKPDEVETVLDDLIEACRRPRSTAWRQRPLADGAMQTRRRPSRRRPRQVSRRSVAGACACTRWAPISASPTPARTGCAPCGQRPASLPEPRRAPAPARERLRRLRPRPPGTGTNLNAIVMARLSASNTIDWLQVGAGRREAIPARCRPRGRRRRETQASP